MHVVCVFVDTFPICSFVRPWRMAVPCVFSEQCTPHIRARALRFSVTFVGRIRDTFRDPLRSRCCTHMVSQCSDAHICKAGISVMCRASRARSSRLTPSAQHWCSKAPPHLLARGCIETQYTLVVRWRRRQWQPRIGNGHRIFAPASVGRCYTHTVQGRCIVRRRSDECAPWAASRRKDAELVVYVQSTAPRLGSPAVQAVYRYAG